MSLVWLGVVLVSVSCPGPLVLANLELASVFGDNMVLQADQPIEIWGTADAYECVAVAVGELTMHTVADAEGNWSVTFAPLAASDKAVTLRVEGSEVREISNVLVGEVWLAAGQSNMAWPLNRDADAAQELPRANVPALRVRQLSGAAPTGNGAYTAQQLARLAPDHYLQGDWKRCRSETAGSFSAVAYYFAARLHRSLNVPVGVVCPAVGGTPTESWIRRAALRQSPAVTHLATGNWLENAAIGQWCRERAQENLNWREVDPAKLSGDDLGP